MQDISQSVSQSVSQPTATSWAGLRKQNGDVIKPKPVIPPLDREQSRLNCARRLSGSRGRVLISPDCSRIARSRVAIPHLGSRPDPGVRSRT